MYALISYSFVLVCLDSVYLKHHRENLKIGLGKGTNTFK